MDPIYTRKGRGGVTVSLFVVEDDGADYRLKVDRPGLAGMSVPFSNTEFDELVAARDAHRTPTQED